jgi:hypothetical protein
LVSPIGVGLTALAARQQQFTTRPKPTAIKVAEGNRGKLPRNDRDAIPPALPVVRPPVSDEIRSDLDRLAPGAYVLEIVRTPPSDESSRLAGFRLVDLRAPMSQACGSVRPDTAIARRFRMRYERGDST